MDSSVFPSQPVSLMGSIRAGKPISTTDVKSEQQLKDRRDFLAVVAENSKSKPYNMDQFMSAGQFYFSQEHYNRVEELHAALDKATSDIVDRWYSDEKAAFPARMPLRANEDNILRWISGAGRAVVPPFKVRQGNWRPDYLLEKVVLPDGTVTENLKLCEINARFPWNAFIVVPHTARVMDQLGIAKAGMKPGMPSSALTNLFGLFDNLKPLHFVNEKFKMRDPLWLAELFRAKTGQKVRFIKPSDLKWLPDESCDGGYGVFCTTEDGSGVERVYQVDFELEQEEFADIDFDILCHLAPNCINDLRSVFFVNDQRFLGVVYEELDDLVSRGTLTQQEAGTVRQGLAPSFLPTSSTWSKVIEECKADPTTKDQWVLKYARSGLSKGHVFGKVTNGAEWLEKLMSAQASNSNPEGDSYVLQQYIEQTEYDNWSHLTKDIMRSHLISTYFSSNGKFLGLGGVRTADLTILSFADGAGFAMIAVTAP
ncbi:hypothetical protein CONLIGDRAFT_684835 [Coniochaeta ligniaria NRRL 30616]|uniref:Uncharacterized protein n=1 Tax=Coniochaeta ligniaria NRRL 30616 TaxID=1408157 RepID=A0A1J7JBI9_9PEZI|nr:hypothetical protein CONLIGDRAFT_684835 [Coniochaeta ligniaria NRRL 30616]